MHAATLWDARIRMMCLRKTEMLEIPLEMSRSICQVLATMARALRAISVFKIMIIIVAMLRIMMNIIAVFE